MTHTIDCWNISVTIDNDRPWKNSPGKYVDYFVYIILKQNDDKIFSKSSKPVHHEKCRCEALSPLIWFGYTGICSHNKFSGFTHTKYNI